MISNQKENVELRERDNAKYLEHKVKLKKDFIVDVPRIKIKLVHYFK